MDTRKNSIVFSPAYIGKVEIKNRLVRSATYENAATPDGYVTELLVDIFKTLAKGGVGLIITGIWGVDKKGLSAHFVPRIYDDAFIPGIRKISQVVHSSGDDCKIMAQLHHPGRQVVHPEVIPRFSSFFPKAYLSYIKQNREALRAQKLPSLDIEATAPSPVPDTLFERTPRALTVEEIEEIIKAFAKAIGRAEEGGMDGVQLHAAHGYLLSTFLSPRTNLRDDRYGGSTENRTRILVEIYRRARKTVSENFPITVKMNTTDFLVGGMDVDEATRVGQILSETGFAAIETSGGMWEAVTRSREELHWPPVIFPESRTEIKSPDQEAYFLPGAKAMKQKIDKPVILVGGLKSFDKIESILQAGEADLVALSRPLIRQPDLPHIWLHRSGNDKAECISCNACIPLLKEPLRCRAKRNHND